MAVELQPEKGSLAKRREPTVLAQAARPLEMAGSPSRQVLMLFRRPCLTIGLHKLPAKLRLAKAGCHFAGHGVASFFGVAAALVAGNDQSKIAFRCEPNDSVEH
jgi:hypothetical protein